MLTIIDEQTEVEPTALTEIVHVRRRFLRSVNLERDFYSAQPLDGYVLTSSALLSLQRIFTGIHKTYARAFTLTGPYGTGKSSLALYAGKVLSASSDEKPSLRAALCKQNPAFADMLFDKEKEGYWLVLLTGAREPIGVALWRGLFEALDHWPEKIAKTIRASLKKEFSGISKTAIPSAREVVALYTSAARHARKLGDGCQGLFVVVDELGKFLEYAALHPDKGDMQVLQEMAEFAARSADDSVMLITILHQSFSDYASKLSDQQRTEWQKVQGRFADIPFGDSPEETIRLMAHAIEVQDKQTFHKILESTVIRQMDGCRDLKLSPPTISASEFQQILQQTYPLHPLTLRITPYVFRRYGQNERSLFSFLSSQEPFGFHEFLRTHTITTEHAPVLRIDHLYDYIVATLGSALYSHATAKLWGETEEALHRLRDADPLQSRLLKTIGLLHILGEQTRIMPSKEVLIFALVDDATTPEQVEAALISLQTATLITYRQFRNAYRPYEGSDIDVEDCLREARSHFTEGTDGVRIASMLGVTQPIVARRHSYQKGTLRFFEVRYCRPGSLEDEIKQGYSRADGLLLLCLASTSAELSDAEEKLRLLLTERSDIIVGLNVENNVLHEAAVALQCLTWVQENTDGLRNDGVARREIKERILEATSVFQTQWENLLRPQEAVNSGGVWYHHGDRQELNSFRELQELVSDACDQSYRHTPRLLNELINRRQLSSTAAAARRDLIQAMIERRETERLGMVGYPPQASMYRSILESTGIHRSHDGGNTWGFCAPDVTQNPELARVWEEMEDFFFNGTLEPKPLERLVNLLRAQPYGLTEGVIPVLICAVTLCYEAEVAVYEDGKFITDLDSATFERMIKRPEGFRLQGCRIIGERQSVLDRFANGLLRDSEERTLANVVRALYRQFNRLPDYTLKTRRLEDDALALRDMLREGKEPEQLLFIDLPRLLGAYPFVAGEADPDNADLFFQRWNIVMASIMGAYDGLLDRLEKGICDSFGVHDWQELRARALAVVPHVGEARLKSFSLRASDDSHKRKPWMEAVAAGLVSRPPNVWSDAEEERFNNSLQAIVSAFRNSELVAFEKTRRPDAALHTGVRIAVTADTGEESARISVVRSEDDHLVRTLTKTVFNVLKELLGNCSEDVRVAVISKVAQEFLREKTND